MNENKLYDVAIVGGGLAGLALSIQSARAGYKTILFEKEKYLPLGGFGLSRYKLDAMLADIAKRNGVEILERMKVEDIKFENEIFNVQSSLPNIQCKVTIGSFGKRSNLD